MCYSASISQFANHTVQNWLIYKIYYKQHTVFQDCFEIYLRRHCELKKYEFPTFLPKSTLSALLQYITDYSLPVQCVFLTASYAQGPSFQVES